MVTALNREADTDPLTVDLLLTNPPGAHTRQVAARYQIIQSMEQTFRLAMDNSDMRRRFQARFHLVGPNRYLAHVRVPSSELPVEFDVFLVFSAPEKVKSLRQCLVKVYSNSPGWIFTYGYAFNKAGLVPKELVWALGRAADEEPRMTNPTEELGFDKSVHQAMLWVLRGPAGVETVSTLAILAGSDARRPLWSDPAVGAEAKLAQYRRAQQKRSAEKKDEKEAERRAQAREESVKAVEQAKKRAERQRKKRGGTEAATKKSGIKPAKSVSAVRAAGSRPGTRPSGRKAK